METVDVWFICGFVGISAFIIGICVGDGIKTLFCRHDYEEVYRHESYDRKEDVEAGLTNGVDIGYVCKKCKKAKCVSTTFQPSSKTCSNCGNIKETLTLQERTYHCNVCGYEEDRDVNAAKNIVAMALAGNF